MSLAENRRVVAKGGIPAGVLDHKQVLTADGVVAKGDVARWLAHLKAVHRLAPLAGFIDQSQYGDGGFAQLGRLPGEGVEGGFMHGIEYLIRVQRG